MSAAREPDHFFNMEILQTSSWNVGGIVVTGFWTLGPALRMGPPNETVEPETTDVVRFDTVENND